MGIVQTAATNYCKAIDVENNKIVKNKSGNSLFFKGGMKAQYLISVLRYIKCIHCDNSTIMIPYANENHTS
jgi:hypothetical protein